MSRPLLDALLALKPNFVYTMGSAKDIARASSLYAQGVVSFFRWGKSGLVLQVGLALEGNPSLLLTFEGGKICSSAQPPYHDSPVNVMAALMTISRVLHGSKFHARDLPETAIRDFRHELGAPPAEPSRPVVTLTEGLPGRRFELDYGTGGREISWRVANPGPGMEWLRWQEREPEKVAESFCRWLDKKPPDAEIVVRCRDGEHVLGKASSTTLRGKISFSVEGGQVAIRKVLIDEAGNPLFPFYDLGYGMAFLPARGQFARVEGIGAWDSACGRVAFRPGDATLWAQPATFFAPYPEAAASDWMLAGSAGEPVQPVQFVCFPSIEATTEGKKVRVRLRVAAEGGTVFPAHAALSEEFQKLFADGPFALLVSRPGQRRRIAERLAAAALAPGADEAERIAAALESDPVFLGRSMHGADAAKCLRHLLGELQVLDGLHFAATGAEAGNPWLSCVGAGRALALSLAAFFHAFPGEDPLRAKDLAFEMDALPFFENLAGLSAHCGDCGVRLFVDDRETVVEALDLSVRVLRASERDWFDLHTEVRAGSLTIPQADWERVIGSGHFLRGNGSLVAFDAKSLDLLRRVAKLAGPVGGGEGAMRVPRLGIFDWLGLREEGVACELPAEDASVLESLRSLESIPHFPLPGGLRADLREYQRHGYDWLCFLYTHRFGACLADDMGLGKTLQAIALLAAIQEGLLPRRNPDSRAPHLVVLPPTLLFNWQNEIARFAPSLKIHEYTGQGRSAEFGDADLVLTTYDLVRRDIAALSATVFGTVIFDEAQALKNALAARTRAASRIASEFRICLTGTPLENHIGELHSIMGCAVPGLLGDPETFVREHEAGLPVLSRVKPFLLRRTKEKILSELPPKSESDALFSMTDPQRECYTRAVGEVREEVLAAYEESPSQRAGIAALAALMRLRQICISPAMVSDTLDAGSPKIEYLVSQLAELAEEGHAALVFSQFVKALKLTSAALEAAGLPFLYMDGSTKAGQRKDLVERFQSGASPGVFLISLKTGGTGITLTRASYVFHLDPWWNPAVENQASDRAHRIGQQRGVFVQRLLMRHTIEEKMMALKARKQALFESVMGVGGTATPVGAAALSGEDFRFLLDT